MIIIIISFWVFHTSISWWFLTEAWVAASLLDSSQYSGQSQQCCSLDGFHSSSYFQVLQSLYQTFSDCTKSTNYDWYNHYFHVLQFFQFPSKVQVLILLFAFFQFYSVLSQVSKVHNLASFLSFFADYYKVWSSGWD